MLTEILIATAYFVAFLTTSSAIHSCPSKSSYEGFSAISIVPTTKKHVSLLSSFLSHPCKAFLFRPTEIQLHERNIVVISSSSLAEWKQAFSESSYNVITNDLASLLNSTSGQKKSYSGAPSNDKFSRASVPHNDIPSGASVKANNSTGHVIDTQFYRDYYTLDVLQEKWTNLSTQYPDNVELKVIGRSFQDRPIYALFVGHTDSENPRRVFINSLLHAREWVTPPAVTYAAERLAVEAANLKQPYLSLLKEVQIIFVPVANPDGYEITATTDRLWRKNLRSGNSCAGVDLNRNWDLDFKGPHSTSNIECSDLYTGPFAFSEPEAQALRDLVLETPGIRVHIDVHSYSQIVIGPWSYTDEIPPNLDVIESLGNGITTDISNYNGVSYDFSLHAKQSYIYMASGTMSDWVFSKNILSFGFELRPSRSDIDAFFLPKREILPTCEEVFASIPRILRAAKNPISTEPTLSPTPSQSVASDLEPSREEESQSILSTGVIIIVCAAAAVVVIAVLLGVIFAIFKFRRTAPDSMV